MVMKACSCGARCQVHMMTDVGERLGSVRVDTGDK
jgi:hypothetical protein